MFSNYTVNPSHESLQEQIPIAEAIHFLALLNERFHDSCVALLRRRNAGLRFKKLDYTVTEVPQRKSDWIRLSQWTTAELPPQLKPKLDDLQIEQMPKAHVQPRDWNSNEVQVQFSGRTMPAALLDFGVAAYHMAYRNSLHGSAICFDLIDIRDHLDARLWNDIFSFSERTLGLAPGTFKSRVFIGSPSAEIELEEIIFELKDRLAGVISPREQITHELIEICERRRCLYFLELEQ